MNSHEALILFIAAVIVASLAVYTLNAQFQAALSEAESSASIATRRAGTSFQILSVYGDSSDTNIVVKGILGSIPVDGLTAFVDNVPYTPSGGQFVRDTDSDGVLDQGDLYVLTIPVSVDADKNCVHIVSSYAEDIYGNCFN